MLQESTWGVAFEVVGSQITEALEHLGMRECLLGGYDVRFVSFHPRDSPGVTIPALVFSASPDNPYYMGKSPVDIIAHEVVDAEGASGHNVEYVLRLTEYVRHHIPEDQDEHLFGLEYHVLRILESKDIHSDSLIVSASLRTHLYRQTQTLNTQSQMLASQKLNSNFQKNTDLNNSYSNSTFDNMKQNDFNNNDSPLQRKRTNSQSA